MKILQVNTHDVYGGAARIAWDLWNGYQDAGNDSRFIVGEKRSNDEKIIEFPRDLLASNPLFTVSWQLWKDLRPLDGKIKGIHRARRYFYDFARWKSTKSFQKGYEDFDYPDSWKILDLLPEKPDLVQVHNLHGGYFDLRLLSELSHRVPLVLTLHDTWLLSGHCAYSLKCERWKIGCGKCPDLKIYPSVPKDKTDVNWQRKREIYRKSCIYVATPSRWLMDKVHESIIMEGILQEKVIPNGINLNVFTTCSREKIRYELNLPKDAIVLVFVASDLTKSQYKDFATLRMALILLSQSLPDEKIIFLALGEGKREEIFGHARLIYKPFENDIKKVAKVYQVGDIYIHAAKADTFPTTILEALACGIPVVGSNVGGIPEQIIEGKTGFLVPPEEPLILAQRVEQLIQNETLRLTMGEQAAHDARQRFNLQLQVNRYLTWFEDVLKDWMSLQKN
jgi:glycosyltransferase involved in cell wall biosynthesis